MPGIKFKSSTKNRWIEHFIDMAHAVDDGMSNITNNVVHHLEMKQRENLDRNIDQTM